MRIILYLFIIYLLSLSSEIFGQGCVAIRHFSSCSSVSPKENHMGKGIWQIGMNYRYFKSFRHFRGTHEEPDRVSNQTEVINHSHSWDFSVSFAMSDRWYSYLTLPFVLNTRSSLYEHGRSERHTSFSRGLGDIRVGAGYWLLDPVKNPAGNLALGAGIKLPTGNYQATDLFYNVGPDGRQEVRPVDQSIQPGDGGFGVSLDLQMYRQISHSISVFASGFYLINPRETNRVRTFRETLSPLLMNESVMSVPDQYAIRAGAAFTLPVHWLSFSLSGRYEGVPVEDLIGDSDGFRRPGRVASVEPGLNLSSGPWMVNLLVPIAVFRERPQSLTDLETQMNTGSPRHGDAAFADYLINLGITYRLPGK